MSAEVVVDWPVIRRAWARVGFLSTWLLVECSLGRDSAEIEAACDAGDAALVERGLDSGGWAAPVVNTSRGVVLHHYGTEDETLARAWVEAFAGSLAAAGQPARIVPARNESGPEWAFGWQVPRQLTTFLAYRMSDQARQRPVHEQIRMWGVDQPLTEAVAAFAAEWVTMPGARVYLSRSTFKTRTSAEGLVAAAAGSLLDGYITRLSAVATKPARVRTAGFTDAGQTVYMARDDSQPWRARLEELRRTLVALPADTQLGFARYSVSMSLSWADIGSPGSPRPPLEHPQSFGHRPAVHTRLVPDAHGMQLLTGEHLKRANSLTEWDVEKIAPDRYLVTSKHLPEWFADGPNQDTLRAARDDFGAMIARDEDLK